MIFEKGPKPNGQNRLVGAAIYTCQVGADFGFKVFCRILYKVRELDGQTDRTVALPNHFRRKWHVGVNMSVIPCFDTPNVEGYIYLC